MLLRNPDKITPILDSISDGVMTLDTRGAITSFNPAAETLLGYQETAVLDRNFADLFVPHEGEHDFSDCILKAVYHEAPIQTHEEVPYRNHEGAEHCLDLTIYS